MLISKSLSPSTNNINYPHEKLAMLPFFKARKDAVKQGLETPACGLVWFWVMLAKQPFKDKGN